MIRFRTVGSRRASRGRPSKSPSAFSGSSARVWTCCYCSSGRSTTRWNGSRRGLSHSSAPAQPRRSQVSPSVLTLERIEPFRRIDESLMLRAPVLHALVLLGTTCQLTTGPRLTMPASGGMPGGPVATVTIQDFSFSPATLSVRVGSTIQWTNKGPSPHTATSDLGVWDSGQLSPPLGSNSLGGPYRVTLTTTGIIHYDPAGRPPHRLSAL